MNLREGVGARGRTDRQSARRRVFPMRAGMDRFGCCWGCCSSSLRERSLIGAAADIVPSLFLNPTLFSAAGQYLLCCLRFVVVIYDEGTLSSALKSHG